MLKHLPPRDARIRKQKGDEQHDITNQIFPIDDAEEQDKEVSNKEKFLRADLLVPGISLKSSNWH